MPETNGGGRLDRIEAILERTGQRLDELTEKFHLMVDHHEAEFKQLMTWQVLMQEKMDRFERERDDSRKRLDQMWANTDARIEKLVSAIGALVAKGGTNA